MPNNEEKITATWMKEAQKGYIRIGVLILLNKKPAHGYELMKEIKDRTKGFWSPTPGGVYPVLASLEKDRYIKGEWSLQRNRRIKIYRITQLGENILKKVLVKQNEIIDNINSLFKDFSINVLDMPQNTAEMPKMPTPFSAFLEDNKDAQCSVEQLEEQRKHLIENIKMHQEELDKINRLLAQKKRKTNQA